MSNVHNQIASRIQAFATELEELVRRAALEAVAQSLGAGAGGGSRGSARTAAPRGRRVGKGGKRPPGELAALVDKTAKWISGNPGQGVETMAKALGVRTRELALPIAKLLKSKTIKKRGQKRATKYFPA